MSIDERRGRPSASSVYRYAACPGSYRMAINSKEFRTQEMTEWADSGTRIHAMLAGEPVDQPLTPEELETVSQCAFQREEAIKEADLGQTPIVMNEKRLWLKHGARKLLSGKADVIAIGADGIRGLVLDYKTGRGEQDPIESNWQIKANIVLAADANPNVQAWYGGIIQPLVSFRSRLICYSAEDVARFRVELIGLLEALRCRGAPTFAGAHCKYCPAVLECSSAKGMLSQFGMVDPATSDAKVLAEYLELTRAAKPLIKRIEEKARSLIKENPEAVPGWALGKPTTTRSVRDPFECFSLLVTASLIDRDTFLKDCVSVGIGDLEKAVGKCNSLKPTEAKQAVMAVCSSVIETKLKEPSLEKVA